MDYVIGIDECGLGSLAGPITACACAIPVGWKKPYGLNDSKKLSPKRRAEIRAELVKDTSIFFFVVHLQAKDVDIDGVSHCLYVAHFQSFFFVKNLVIRTGHRVIDAVLDGDLELKGCRSVIKADEKFPAVMAASIIGKVNRDEIMARLSKRFPEFELHKNCGYPTKKHLEVLRKCGPQKGLHRMSYAPCKEMLK